MVVDLQITPKETYNGSLILAANMQVARSDTMRPAFSVMITGEKIIRKNYLVFVNGQMRMSTPSADYLIHGTHP